MSLSKRVKLAVLCLIVVVALCAAASASPFPRGSATLQPVVGGDEPSASGVAKEHQTGWIDGPYGRMPWGNWSLTCTGLTPGAAYGHPWGTAAADRKGSLSAQGKGVVGAALVQVYRVEPTGNVLVLSGSVVWNPK